MPIGATRIAIVLVLAGTAAYARYVGAFGPLRRRLNDRFVYGVPWGSAVVVGGVLAFYLFAQSGLDHWSEPVVFPFRSWSYYYPTGMLTAGFAHASPGHLVGNLAGTAVFAPLVEYAWGHYPRGDRGSDEADRGSDDPDPGDDRGSREASPTHRGDDTGSSEADPARRGDDWGFRGAGPTRPEDDPGSHDGGPARGGDGGTARGWLARPWVRALVAFPAAVAVVSLLTSVLALGFSLGFSGTVFAFVGLALVYYPLATVVGLLGNALVATTYRALTDPLLRATADPGPPGPPDWFGVNVQAHGLGLLIGALLGIALLYSRDRRPDAGRLLLASLLVTVALGLYELAWSDGDVYLQYRGIGLVVVLGLAVAVTAAAVSSSRPFLSGRTAQGLAVGWIGLVVVGTVVLAGPALDSVAAVRTAAVPLAVVVGLVSLPALYVVWITTRRGAAVSRRQAAVYAVVVLAVLVTLPSIFVNLSAVPGDPAPGPHSIEVRDYEVAYGENVSSGAVLAVDPGEPFGSPESGVILASGPREIWSDAVSKQDLAYSGTETVVLGGIGWRETVRAERVGWSVTGNGTAYAVDLHHDGETVRSFVSDPVTASPTVANHTVAVVPTRDGFDLRVTADGSVVDEVPIPGAGASTTVGEVQIATRTVDGTDRVVVERGGTSVTVAERETYE